MEEHDKEIWALEEEVEELKPKVCQCARVEDKISAPDEVRVQQQWVGCQLIGYL